MSGGVSPKNIALNQFREVKKAGYFGISEGGYLNAPYADITLNKNRVLKDLKISGINGMTSELISGFNLNSGDLVFPNESWKDLNRYLKVSKISFETEEQNKLILIGSVSLILMQATIHIGVNIRLFPTTGMTLPFLSYGGSSIVSTSILTGIILNLTKRKI